MHRQPSDGFRGILREEIFSVSGSQQDLHRLSTGFPQWHFADVAASVSAVKCAIN
jgi:hypothetical protein